MPQFAADLPPQMRERVVCSVSAAARYEVPANIVLAVAEKEAGQPGQWVRNANGTHDVGPMQFNTAYLADLARYGIEPADVAAAGCYPYDLAAWRLRMHIRNDAGDLWTRAANYHSRTPRHNAVYRADLMRRAARWAGWLEARLATRDVGGHSAPAPARPTPAPAAATIRPAPSRATLAGYVPRAISFKTAEGAAPP
ncbi:muramidase [Ramlibacter sp. H39-3-26]|uniref:muramidase n=1 Tax=Curvibacter soli TaxID=3031331 RepID=UPI0023DA4F94|nr:muramidase [Ramlibacter sp. H39-3-26]MDF1486014.1 muramidase [Ramlibacter sp. H39-3-26]